MDPAKIHCNNLKPPTINSKLTVALALEAVLKNVALKRLYGPVSTNIPMTVCVHSCFFSESNYVQRVLLFGLILTNACKYPRETRGPALTLHFLYFSIVR